MAIAREVATRSTCDRKHVGAVIVRDKLILTTGYNGSVRGLAHCDDEGHLIEDGHCVRTIHAEANAIVQAARVSYGLGTKAVHEDRGLIRYLMRHQHSTPFEMVEMKLHVKLPIFVARQWIRHRTANVNEYSARYSILDREFYIPAPEQLAAQSVANRQGRGDVLTGAEARRVLDALVLIAEHPA